MRLERDVLLYRTIIGVCNHCDQYEQKHHIEREIRRLVWLDIWACQRSKGPMLTTHDGSIKALTFGQYILIVLSLYFDFAWLIYFYFTNVLQYFSMEVNVPRNDVPMGPGPPHFDLEAFKW